MFQRKAALMVQSDMTIWMNSEHPEEETIRRTLSGFAELIKSPGTWHTYHMTPVTLWNAAAANFTGEKVLTFLSDYSAYPLPDGVKKGIIQAFERYGTLHLFSQEKRLFLYSVDPLWLEKWIDQPPLKQAFVQKVNEHTIEIQPRARGMIKMELGRKGYPVEDRAGHDAGNRLSDRGQQRLLRPDVKLRDYQKEAVQIFCQPRAGSGMVVLPCGAGKTIVGLAILNQLNCATLILTSNRLSVEQWKQELLDRTFLTDEQIGEYTGKKKEIKPVTVTTYQMLTRGRSNDDSSSELTPNSLIHHNQWGLIIYDEAHLLPAPIFRMTAEIQAKRRLGLTATLIREDGRETDVFSLIGPKWYDKSWKMMEEEGWIARAICREIRIPLPHEYVAKYEHAGAREQFRLAAQNPSKINVVEQLINKHSDEPLLLIGQYIEQLQDVANTFQIPLIYGKTPHQKRQSLLEAFRRGEIKRLVMSKVANFAVDLPDASVAIQLSGSFGSRQEEAQRLGRILRPKESGAEAWFYSLVSSDTREEAFARRRKLFLIERGYTYDVRYWREQADGLDRTRAKVVT